MIEQLKFLAIQSVRDQRAITRGRRSLVREAMPLHELSALTWATRSWARRVQDLFVDHDPGGPIWAIMMAQNEERRISTPVRHLVEQGVDIVVVINHRSTDHTREVLADLARDLPVVTVENSAEGFYQGASVSRMARAASKRNASWVVPVDADELWYGVGASISSVLRATTAAIIKAPVWDHLPLNNGIDSPSPYKDFTKRTVSPGPKHVAFRAHPLASVHEGNHWVNRSGEAMQNGLEVRHFAYLGFPHFVEKMRRGAKNVGATDLSMSIALEWRAWGTADEQGLVAAWNSLLERASVEDPAPLGAGAVGTITPSWLAGASDRSAEKATC